MNTRWFKFVATAMWMLSLESTAALRCDLTMQRVAQDKASCIDPAQLNGSTVKVPSNVTRIGKEGLALCGQKSSSNLATDIEYIIDNSNSMTSKVFWVDPATVDDLSPDTSWYISNCLAKVKGTKVALRKRHFGGKSGYLSMSWDTLLQVPSSSERPSLVDGKACLEANDPYSMRAAVVQTAMQYQASLDSSAQAGMIQFNTDVQQETKLRALNGAAYLRLLDSTGLYDGDGGTNWNDALSLAFSRLKASANSQKAIIMVSDGIPDKDDKYATVIAQAGFPKVFGIYLSTTDVPADMVNLTTRTGGKYWVVPPNRPDSMISVIRAIVGSVMQVSTPASTRLTNLTNAQSSNALAIEQASDSTYHLQLDSVIALTAGKNNLQLVSTWTDEKGKVNSDTSKFTLDVSGTVAIDKDTVSVPGDTVFATACANPSSLSILDPNKAEVPYLTESMGWFDLRLVPSGSDPLVKNIIQLKEWRKGDKESVANLTKQSGNDYIAAMVLQVPRPWKNAVGKLDADDGLDTLSASWCYPRDARDCAEDTIQIQSFSNPWVRWEVDDVQGPAGALGAKAFLPGTTGSVTVTYSLHGKVLVKRTMVKGVDSLYHDTLNFRQGGVAVGPDSVWISKPSFSDSIVVSVLWELKDTTLADTARIRRPSLVLDLQKLGDDSTAIGLSKGAQPNASGKWVVKLLVGTRTASITMDSLYGQGGVMALLGGSSGTTATVRGLFVDPVYGDSAWDSISVPVPLQSLRFQKESATGPRGMFDLTARVPWETAAKIRVLIAHGNDSTPIWLTRAADGSYLGSFAFAQSLLAGGDTIALGAPTRAGGTDSVQAVLPSDGLHEALKDQAKILRPALTLDVVRSGRDSVVLTLSAGAQADAKGLWNVGLRVEGETSPAVLTGRSMTVSVQTLLAKALQNQAWVVGRFVDPLYGDTVTDSVQIPVPQRSLKFAVRTVEGPRGQLTVIAYDPWVTGNKYSVLFVHGKDTTPVVLERTVAGDFSGTVAFSQARLAGGDTLALGAPTKAGARDSLIALLPGDGVHPALRDTTWITRPQLSLEMSIDSARPQLVHLSLSGGTPDLKGKADVSVTKPASAQVAMEGAGKFHWNGSTSFVQLSESKDSVTVSGYFVDPLYQDTAWAAVRMASPWFPGSIVISPDSADPRKGDSVTITVMDHDPDNARKDSVEVTVGSLSWIVQETSDTSGIYVLRLPVGKLDPQWMHRLPRTPWKVTVQYRDPRHDQDISHAQATLWFDVPPAEVAVQQPLVEKPTGKPNENTPERTNGSKGMVLLPLPTSNVPSGSAEGHAAGSQGIAIRLWEKVNVAVFVYDMMGVSVNYWSGTVVPTDGEKGSAFVLSWDGRDQTGRPATSGVYLARVVTYAMDGKLLSNSIVRMGLR